MTCNRVDCLTNLVGWTANSRLEVRVGVTQKKRLECLREKLALTIKDLNYKSRKKIKIEIKPFILKS